MHTADYCPMNVLPVRGSNSINGMFEYNCKNETIKTNIAVEYYGQGSRCIESNVDRPLCLRTVCDQSMNKVVIYVNNMKMTCNFDGEWLNIPGSGSDGLAAGAMIQCPVLNIACPE